MELVIYRLCEKFGWTPDQLDNVDAHLVNAFLQIISLEAQLANQQSK